MHLRCPLVYDDSALQEQIAKLQEQMESLQKELIREREENDRKGKVIDRLLSI
jgi:septal ring factor EnvC (AmiA/AmiB activator)